jgi:hypothetical protein
VARDEWISETAGPSWLGRLVSPGSNRPGSLPFLVLAAAVVAFVCSLAIDWIGVTAKYTVQNDRNVMNIYGAVVTTDGGHSTLVTGGNVSGLELMGLVYGLGTLGLVTLGFTVLSRPDLALRFRLAVAGLGIGLLGLVVAAAIKLPAFLIVNGSFASGGTLDSLQRSYKPGIFCAVAAAVLPVIAVWIRSAPAARSAIDAEQAARLAPATPTSPAPPATPPASRPTTAPDASVVFGQYDPDPGRWRRAPSAPFDMTVTPDE